MTEATGIWGTEAEEKEYEAALEVIGDEVEVTAQFFSTRLGEFSHALRADSIWTNTHKQAKINEDSLSRTHKAGQNQ